MTAGCVRLFIFASFKKVHAMKRFIRSIIQTILLVGCLLPLILSKPTEVQAQTVEPENPVYIYLFWGDGCPHCARAKPYFESLAAQYDNIVYKEYEVYYDPAGQEFFLLMAQQAGIEQFAVPTIFIGPYYVQGYSEEMDAAVVEVVELCTRQLCVDAGAGLLETEPQREPTSTMSVSQVPTEMVSAEPTSTATPQPQPTATPEMTVSPIPVSQENDQNPVGLQPTGQIELPWIGTIDASQSSPFFSTILIALVDGFNPCSLWVLTMLLALTLHTGSRKKVLVVGFIFLTVTAGIYALFIAGLFSVLSIAGFLIWIRVLVVLVALLFGVVNIKDYYWYKQGLSFTIADSKKPAIYKRMRNVVQASQSFPAMVGSTAVLAAGVSLVEFSCTAGFPVIWTNLITAQNITGAAFLLLLAIYMVIYQLDEMIIFGISVVTLKASRLEEKHGRVLKLVSGVLMITLAVVMLINPAWMNDLFSSLLVFGFAFGLTILILAVHRLFSDKGNRSAA